MSTLYLTQPGAQLHKDHDRLLVKRGEEVLEAVPLIKIDQVVLMGRGVSISTSALHALTRMAWMWFISQGLENMFRA